MVLYDLMYFAQICISYMFRMNTHAFFPFQVSLLRPMERRLCGGLTARVFGRGNWATGQPARCTTEDAYNREMERLNARRQAHFKIWFHLWCLLKDIGGFSGFNWFHVTWIILHTESQ